MQVVVHDFSSSKFSARDAVYGYLIGASLSEPHTSGTALRKCVTYVLACLRPYTVNFKCAFKYFPKLNILVDLVLADLGEGQC